MNEFSVEVQRNRRFLLDIQSSCITGELSSVESTVVVESSDKINSALIIDASFISHLNDITIENFTTYNLEVLNNNGMTQYVLPDSIPIESLVGNLHVSRIDGLDDYLDSYSFDCGTP
jgi:predicted acyltransferase (DUF342 family)